MEDNHSLNLQGKLNSKTSMEEKASTKEDDFSVSFLTHEEEDVVRIQKEKVGEPIVKEIKEQEDWLQVNKGKESKDNSDNEESDSSSDESDSDSDSDDDEYRPISDGDSDVRTDVEAVVPGINGREEAIVYGNNNEEEVLLNNEEEDTTTHEDQEPAGTIDKDLDETTSREKDASINYQEVLLNNEEEH